MSPSRSAVLAAAFLAVAASPALASYAAEASPGFAAARSVVDEALHWIAMGIEAAGVGVLVVGAVSAVVFFLRQGLAGRDWSGAYRSFRANLGRAILLGLEFLVAADIIGTVAVTPTFQSLGVLALIVLIRTFLSISLEVEIEGRWPWRRATDEAGAFSSPPLGDDDHAQHGGGGCKR